MLCICCHNKKIFFSYENVPFQAQSSWQALSMGRYNHPLTSRQSWPIQDWGVLILFSDISREGSPITVLSNLFQCLKTPDILGTRPFLLHLKLIFPWSVSALSGTDSSYTWRLLLHYPPASGLRAPRNRLVSGLWGPCESAPHAHLSPAWCTNIAGLDS